MSLAISYHDATAYAPDTIGGHPGMDWSRQPIPYRIFSADAARVELAPYLPFSPNPFTGGESPADSPASEPLAQIAKLIYGTYGVTGVAEGSPRQLLLRSAPSAGGLYPAELWLVVRDLPGLTPGLYGYDPRRHALVALRRGESLAAELTAACYGSAAVAAAAVCMVMSTVFERSRWRYRERAYRRVLLDSGHVLGNAAMMAHDLGWSCHITTAFHDDGLNKLLSIAPDDQDPTMQEAAVAVVACGFGNEVPRPAWSALPSSTGNGDAAALMESIHAAGDLPERRPAPRALGDAGDVSAIASAATVVLPRSADVHPLATTLWPTLVARRSTRRFRAEAITSAQLASLLQATYQPRSVGLGPPLGCDPALVDVIVIAQAVTGLAAGVYRFDPVQGALTSIRPGVDRIALARLCLGQELGHDAAAAVIATVDLAAAVQLRGDRVYRTLHLDAGLSAQRLALAAVSEGLGSSGIGGFFDALMQQHLGLSDHHAILYPTLIGVPA